MPIAVFHFLLIYMLFEFQKCLRLVGAIQFAAALAACSCCARTSSAPSTALPRRPARFGPLSCGEKFKPRGERPDSGF
jgi:hypothetical protein